MVLMTHKRVKLLMIFFFASSLFVFSQARDVTWNFSSGLIQYGDNIDKERLELLEDHQILNLSGGASPRSTGIYTIHNRGEAYQATLGVVFWEYSGIPSLAEMGIQFFVNGEYVVHTEKTDMHKFIMGESVQELSPMDNTAWALVDVLFPAYNTITVQVQSDDGWGRYNNISQIDSITNLDCWKGSTKFSLEVINSHVNPIGPFNSGGWVANIKFFHITDNRRDINTMEYLRSLQSLQTNLMNIQRLNGGTFRIDFTEEFLNSYRRCFVVNNLTLADQE